MKIVAVIPARLASTRFPRKILYEFFGLPMVEHVRRRALLSDLVDEVYVATCDEEVASLVRKNGGNVVMTSTAHKNGTSRVAEAISSIECTHIILLQGDEPLLIPSHIDKMAQAIISAPEINVWNAVSLLDKEDELDNPSLVKCVINKNGSLSWCFRRTPLLSKFKVQKQFVGKLLGVIGFKKEFLTGLPKLDEGLVGVFESIEQLRILENGFQINAVNVAPNFPSVNECSDVFDVNECFANNEDQKSLLDQVLKYKNL